jgi:hypothetical protein
MSVPSGVPEPSYKGPSSRSKSIQFAHLDECASYMLIFVQRLRPFFGSDTSKMQIKRQLAFRQGSDNSLFPKSRQLWSVFIDASHLNPSVSSVTPAEFLHGLEEIFFAEVRPKLLSYINFRIAQLPEQKI